MHQVQGRVAVVMRFCSKCQQPVRENEKFTKYDVDSGSAAAMTVYWHLLCPPRPRRP